MKRTLWTTVLGLGVIGTLAWGADAAGPGWYLRGDLGVSLAQNTELTDFLEPIAGPTPAVEIEFDPGMQLGVAGGYRLTPWLAVEVESGFLFNSINAVGGQEFEASLLQVPFLGNVVIQCNHFEHFKPFIGAGAGGLSASLMIDDTVNVGEGAVVLDGTDSDVVFAYQAFAGVFYELNDRWSLGVVYRYLGTTAPEWEVDSDFSFSEPGSIAFDDLATHVISLGFRLKL